MTTSSMRIPAVARCLLPAGALLLGACANYPEPDNIRFGESVQHMMYLQTTDANAATTPSLNAEKVESALKEPVLKKFSPCGCALVCVVSECTKQKSSTIPARFGSKSETILPDSPRGLKSQNGLAMLPVGPSKVTAGIPGGFCPCSL